MVKMAGAYLDGHGSGGVHLKRMSAPLAGVHEVRPARHEPVDLQVGVVHSSRHLLGLVLEGSELPEALEDVREVSHDDVARVNEDSGLPGLSEASPVHVGAADVSMLPIRDPDLGVHDSAVVPLGEVHGPDLDLGRQGLEGFGLLEPVTEAGALHDSDADAALRRVLESDEDVVALVSAEGLELRLVEVGVVRAVRGVVVRAVLVRVPRWRVQSSVQRSEVDGLLGAVDEGDEGVVGRHGARGQAGRVERDGLHDLGRAALVRGVPPAVRNIRTRTHTAVTDTANEAPAAIFTFLENLLSSSPEPSRLLYLGFVPSDSSPRSSTTLTWFTFIAPTAFLSLLSSSILDSWRDAAFAAFGRISHPLSPACEKSEESQQRGGGASRRGAFALASTKI